LVDSAIEAAIVDLIEGLDSQDQGEVRVAGNRLIEHGAAARPHLVAAVHTGSLQVRRAAAHLLGRMEASPEAIAALAAAIEDSDAKVRKNAAVSMGKLGDTSSFIALAGALEREEVAWVRPSIVLSLGGLGGQRALSVLKSVEPLSQAEREAVRKAIDRSSQATEACWRTPCPGSQPIYAAAPVGLEDLAVDEAASKGLSKPVPAGPGRVVFEPGLHPDQLIPALRCIYGIQLLVGRMRVAERFDDDELLAAVAGLLDEPLFLREWRDWIECGEECLSYRFTVKGTRISRKLFRRLLELVRSRLCKLQLEDHTSSYLIELRTEISGGQIDVWAVPIFHPDDRFSYRVADVGASINPIVAACLARMVRSCDSSIVVDQTCGSATLLVERAQLDAEVKLYGVDISPTAVQAAQRNVEAAGLVERIKIRRGDASKSASWSACDEVLMNLPFGIRTGRQDRDLPGLYAATARQLARHLKPKGRAVLYTANAKLLASCLARYRTRLTVEKRHRVMSGGLSASVWLIRRSLST
jgi:23S rRNA G2445 N2-methylase RlmL